MQNNKLRTIVVSPAGALPVRWRGARWPLLFLALSRPVTLALPPTSFFLAISMTLSETPTWTVEAAASPDGAEPRARRPRPRLGESATGPTDTVRESRTTHHTDRTTRERERDRTLTGVRLAPGAAPAANSGCPYLRNVF